MIKQEMKLLYRSCECGLMAVRGTGTRFFKASLSVSHNLPSTENISIPTPFWERKMFKRFEKMDWNKVCPPYMLWSGLVGILTTMLSEEWTVIGANL
jgi:hypothetical protein